MSVTAEAPARVAGPLEASPADMLVASGVPDADAGPKPDGVGDGEAVPAIPLAPAAPAATSAPKAQSEGQKGGQKYTFFVGPGNNSELVRATFERRPWWELGKEDDPELNLKWLQVRSRPVADAVRKAGNKQFLNHLDGLQCIGRKNELYFNLKAYCEQQKIDVHSMAPPTFIVSAGEQCPEFQEFARICKGMENKTRKVPQVAKPSDPKSPSKGAGGALADDDASAASTEEAASQASAALIKSPSKAPGKGDGNKSPRKAKVSATRGEAISSINTAGTANMWIVKPTNNNRGNGIRVFNTFNAIDEHLKKKSLGTQVVVQKYIERPLLYKGRKFDIRQLVLVDNKMNIYVYKEFYVRTSSTVYDIANVQDLFIHLTNYAVQKKKKKGKPERELEEDEMDEDDEQQEEGNNLSMAELNDFLLEEGYPMGCDGVVQRIHEIVIKVFLAVWKKLDPLRERNTFEVNTNPYIGCSSALLKKIFTGMLEGALKKCVDPYFGPPEGYSLSDIEDVEGGAGDDWVLVYSADGKKVKRAAEAE